MTPNLSFNLSGANDATQSGFGMDTYSMGTLSKGLSAPTVQAPVNTSLPQVGGTTIDPVTGGGGNGAGMQQGSGFWSKEGGAGLAISGIQTLGSLWNSYQSHKMAKEQMKFAREQFDTNIGMQKQTYNTALEDRIRARHHTEGKGSGQTDAYLNKHKL